ncbi:MAG: L-serine ammonia-lyase, iron-sulfur-dependent, subunit alpha [Anaerorhabdus sp.]
MKSLKELYRIGPGPSSSHTLAPKKACEEFIAEFGLCERYVIDLYGSLSLTGRGHFTDQIIENTLSPADVVINFLDQWEEERPNGFYLKGYRGQELVGAWTVFSLGGGAIEVKEKPEMKHHEIYSEDSLDKIKAMCKQRQYGLPDYVLQNEHNIEPYLNEVLQVMLQSVKRGISTSGELPGSLHIERVAKSLYLQASTLSVGIEKDRLLLMSYAYAASEENASRGEVATAPTLGSCGVMAALMYYFYNDVGVSKDKLIKSLMVAGVFGNLIKQNATISGALGGCQAEVGTACSMASAACAYLEGLNMKQIEYAAEIGMEHHLGLTCDPVGGYVIIPCIERNAIAVLRALDACLLSKYMSKLKGNRISFDMVVRTMDYTGKKMTPELRETSLGGLAKEYSSCHDEKEKSFDREKG